MNAKDKINPEIQQTAVSTLPRKGDKTFATTATFFAWAFVLAFLLVPLVALAVFAYTNLQQIQSTQKYSAYFDLTQFHLGEKSPYSLNGVWNAYEGIYFTEDFADTSLLQDPTEIRLPVTDISKAEGTYTYQAFLQYHHSESQENPVVVGIKFLKEDVTLYLNGRKVDPYPILASPLGNLESMSIFNVSEYYDSSLSHQELLLCINNEVGDTDLFSRPVTISTYANAVFYEKATNLFEFIFVGIVYTLMMVGFIYIIMRSGRSILTLLNIFDTVLISYVMYSLTSIPAYIAVIFPEIGLSDLQIESMSIFFLCMVGAIGNDLVELHFTNEKQIHPFFNHPLNLTFVTASIIFAFFPKAFTGFPYLFLCFLFFVAGFAIIWRLYHYCRSMKPNLYMKFQTGKTLCVLLIIAVDLYNASRSTELQRLLLMLYSAIFIIHLFVRAYEYALPEKQIIEINRTLEETVAKRTEELTNANQVLRNLSTKDPLTNAYNRLHFETELADYLESYNNQDVKVENLYLCVFDLDNFKEINDNFGHGTGDEQLVETIQLATKVLPEDVVISRIGGEEFTLLFINYSPEEVMAEVEKVRFGLEEMTQKEGRTTGSFGISQAKLHGDRKTLFVSADKCLYFAKAQGKNCIATDLSGTLSIATKPMTYL